MDMPEDLIALLREPSPCFLATVMPDGSPQVTQTWADTDGEHAMTVIGELLARPGVALAHLRNVGYGCYNFAVRRG